MGKYAIEIVKKAGINIDELLELLISNAASEMSTYYHYMILRCNLIGIDGESVKEIAEAARIEDRNHYEALVQRIYELGGKLPDNLIDFYNGASCPHAHLPKNPNDTKEIIKTLLQAERCAMAGYNKICNLTVGKDHRTYDLALAILQEETEHESWFAEFLGEGPSGHFNRRGPSSPYVSKFLQ
jgi:ferritin-like protein